MDPGLVLLTGDGVGDLLAAELAASGQEPAAWRVRQVDHRPGTSTTVAYDVTVRGRDGPAREVLGATVAAGSEPQWWRFPLDPSLPALAQAADESAVRDLLAGLRVRAGALRLDVRSYRPRRRAVVEVRAPGCRLFLKVVRPGIAEGLHERHRLLRAAGLPVPRSLGWTEDGLLVLEALGGRSLRSQLRAGGPAVDAPVLLELLDWLPQSVQALPVRRSWSDAVAHYAAVTASVLPDQAARCAQLAERVQQLVGGLPADAPTHGDLHDGQLLVDGGQVVGVLDVDTVGPGRRSDDLACLLAHVSVLAQLEPAHADSSRGVVAAWQAELERHVDPVELRARVAGVVVSLATGPHRVQSAGWQEATRDRLDLAEQWLDGLGQFPVIHAEAEVDSRGESTSRSTWITEGEREGKGLGPRR